MITIPSSKVIFRDTHVCFPKSSVPGECEIPLDERYENKIRIDFDGTRHIDFEFSYLHNMIHVVGDSRAQYYAIESDEVFDRFVGPSIDYEELAPFGDFGSDGWYIECEIGEGCTGYRRLNETYWALFSPQGMRIAVAANSHSIAILYSKLASIAAISGSLLPIVGETTHSWQDHEYHDLTRRT